MSKRSALDVNEARDEALVALGLKEVVWEQVWPCLECMAKTTTRKPARMEINACWRCGTIVAPFAAKKRYVQKKP